MKILHVLQLLLVYFGLLTLADPAGAVTIAIEGRGDIQSTRREVLGRIDEILRQPRLTPYEAGQRVAAAEAQNEAAYRAYRTNISTLNREVARFDTYAANWREIISLLKLIADYDRNFARKMDSLLSNASAIDIPVIVAVSRRATADDQKREFALNDASIWLVDHYGRENVAEFSKEHNAILKEYVVRSDKAGRVDPGQRKPVECNDYDTGEYLFMGELHVLPYGSAKRVDGAIPPSGATGFDGEARIWDLSVGGNNEFQTFLANVRTRIPGDPDCEKKILRYIKQAGGSTAIRHSMQRGIQRSSASTRSLMAEVLEHHQRVGSHQLRIEQLKGENAKILTTFGINGMSDVLEGRVTDLAVQKRQERDNAEAGMQMAIVRKKDDETSQVRESVEYQVKVILDDIMALLQTRTAEITDTVVMARQVDTQQKVVSYQPRIRSVDVEIFSAGNRIGTVISASVALRRETVFACRRDQVDEYLEQAIGVKMVKVRGGYDVPAFYLSEAEITNAQFSRFLRDMPKSEHGRYREISCMNRIPNQSVAEQPAVCVTEKGAEEFMRWLSRLSNRAYRLPEVEEMKYAASCYGNYSYCWGDETCSPCQENLLADLQTENHLQSVKHYDPTPLGFYDLCGNASELCKQNGEYRQMGGFFNTLPPEARLDKVFDFIAPSSFVGFRVARDVK